MEILSEVVRAVYPEDERRKMDVDRPGPWIGEPDMIRIRHANTGHMICVWRTPAGLPVASIVLNPKHPLSGRLYGEAVGPMDGGYRRINQSPVIRPLIDDLFQDMLAHRNRGGIISARIYSRSASSTPYGLSDKQPYPVCQITGQGASWEDHNRDSNGYNYIVLSKSATEAMQNRAGPLHYRMPISSNEAASIGKLPPKAFRHRVIGLRYCNIAGVVIPNTSMQIARPRNQPEPLPYVRMEEMLALAGAAIELINNRDKVVGFMSSLASVITVSGEPTHPEPYSSAWEDYWLGGDAGAYKTTCYAAMDRWLDYIRTSPMGKEAIRQAHLDTIAAADYEEVLIPSLIKMING